MAKKSRKQVVRPKRDNAGCMSGLINIFDFRQGRYTQRLLTDKKLGSKHGRGTSYSNNKFDVLRDLEDPHEDAIDTNPKEKGRVDSSKASIKALIEEEMSESYISKTISTKVGKARSQLISEANLEKTHKQKSKKCKVGSDHDANESLASQSTCQDLSENTPFDINLAGLMEVFCNESNRFHDEKNDDNVGDRKHKFLSELDLQCTLDHSILQKALGDFAKALLVQKSMDSKESKQSISNGEIQPNKFMDALEMLNSNKELFLKLLQDPDPRPMKLILELQNPQIGDGLQGIREEQQVSHSLSNKQNGHHFFKKKDKSKEAKPLHESSSHALNKIVLLRPSPGRNQQKSNTSSPIPSPNLQHNSQNHQGNERGSFQFTLKEIKRRIKYMIGESKKVRHLITMDGILHKVPYGYQNSDDTVSSYCSPEHTSRFSKLLKKGNKKDITKEHQPQLNTVSNPLYREPVFYEEARKHLTEVVNTGGEIGILPTVRASTPLGRLLSLPEYNSLSPWLSPEREERNDSHKRTYSDNMGALSESIENSQSTLSNRVDDSRALDLNPASLTTKPQIREDMIQKGNNEIEESDNVEIVTECNSRPVFFSERCEIQESSMISEMGTHEEPQPVTPSISISPNFVTAEKSEALESTMETPDHPSPVSVLESINSPETERTRIESKLRGSQTLCFDENEAMALDQTSITSEANLRTSMGDNKTKLEYVRTVLEASGLSLTQFTEKLQSPNQLLDPFVFDEVEISFGQQIDDSRLLFDCVNEVLVEIHERYMSCTPWGSFVRPNIGMITIARNFVPEVCRQFDRYLFLQFPCTLDQVVKKDLDYLAWMDIQFETERTIAETGETILEYIMEEIILELWD